jgi:hypothetical protein
LSQNSKADQPTKKAERQVSGVTIFQLNDKLSDTEIMQGVFDKGYHYNLKPDIIRYVVFQ